MNSDNIAKCQFEVPAGPLTYIDVGKPQAGLLILHRFDVTLLWGMQDVALRPDVLETWSVEFPDALVARLCDVGHLVALEATDVLVGVLRKVETK